MTRAEHFPEGSAIAVDYGDGRIVKRTVGKVYKNGSFIIEAVDPSRASRPDKWRPYGDRASPIGEGQWGRAWASPWTPALEQEATRQMWDRRHKRLCRGLTEMLSRPGDLDHGFVEDLCEFIAAKAVQAYGTQQ